MSLKDRFCQSENPPFVWPTFEPVDISEGDSGLWRFKPDAVKVVEYISELFFPDEAILKEVYKGLELLMAVKVSGSGIVNEKEWIRRLNILAFSRTGFKVRMTNRGIYGTLFALCSCKDTELWVDAQILEKIPQLA